MNIVSSAQIESQTNTYGFQRAGRDRSTSVNSQSLQTRCESPLVLMNNVPPEFDTSHNQTPQIRLVAERSSLFENNARQHEQQQQFNQLPKRTVSLGPRRLQQQQQQQSRPLDTSTAGNFNNPSRFQRQDSRERAQSFNKMADALQSSLSELNNLIETPQTPKFASIKPPKYTSYLTKAPDELGQAGGAQVSYAKEATTGNGSPEAGEQTIFDWRADLMNWKASSSMNDLRSMFELKPTNLDLPPHSSATLRPPRSASPSFLKSSPWQNQMVGSSSTRTSNTNLKAYPEADYTIRRTTSTQVRSSNNAGVRNPYRSRYG